MPKKEHSAPKTTFSQAEISYENEGRTFRPNDSFEKKTHRAEKRSWKKYFPQSLRKLISSTGSKSNKEVTLKIRETSFLHKKLQKTKKCEKSRIVPNFFWFSARLEPTYPCFLGSGKSALTTRPNDWLTLQTWITFGGTILASMCIETKTDK